MFLCGKRLPSDSVKKIFSEPKSIMVGLEEALGLIPDFSGEEDEIAFVYFREGCNNALRLLENHNKEDLLLTFLKNKLKGNAYKRFSLRLSSYLSIEEFLKNLKHVYACEVDNTKFWISKMTEIHQVSSQSIKEYSAIFQEILECALLGLKYGEVEQNYFFDEKKIKNEMKNLERITTYHFLANMFPGQTKRALERFSYLLSRKSFMELVCVAIKFSEYELLFCKRFCPFSQKGRDNYSFDLKCSYFMKCCNFCETDSHLTENCSAIKSGKSRQRWSQTCYLDCQINN